MSAAVPTIEPSAVTAGDTITWSRALPDYPASAGWVLSYALRGSAGKIDITGAASGNDHLISISAATSAGYTAGTYAWQSYVTKGTERVTVGTGSMEVKQNLAAVSTALDTRTHVKKVLDAIEAVLEGRAAKDQMEITIDGTQLKRTPVADLLKLRSLYLNFYRQEQDALKIAAGTGSGVGKIRVRL